MSGVMLAGYFASAIAALVLAGWLVTHRARLGGTSGETAAALTTTALWAVAVLAFGPAGLAGSLLFSAASLAWLWLLYRLFSKDGRHASLSPIRPVVAALAFVEMLQIAVLLALSGLNRPAAVSALEYAILISRSFL